MASYFFGSCLAAIVHDSGRKGLYVTNTISWSVGKPRSWPTEEKLPAPLCSVMSGGGICLEWTVLSVSLIQLCAFHDALHSTMENCSILYSLTFHPPAYSVLGKQFRSSGMQVGSHFLRWTKQKNRDRFTFGCSPCSKSLQGPTQGHAVIENKNLPSCLVQWISITVESVSLQFCIQVFVDLVMVNKSFNLKSINIDFTFIHFT